MSLHYFQRKQEQVGIGKSTLRYVPGTAPVPEISHWLLCVENAPAKSLSKHHLNTTRHIYITLSLLSLERLVSLTARGISSSVNLILCHIVVGFVSYLSYVTIASLDVVLNYSPIFIGNV